jgi:hypothetical protein
MWPDVVARPGARHDVHGIADSLPRLPPQVSTHSRPSEDQRNRQRRRMEHSLRHPQAAGWWRGGPRTRYEHAIQGLPACGDSVHLTSSPGDFQLAAQVAAGCLGGV